MMKSNLFSLLVLLFLLVGIVVNSQADMTLSKASQEALPLRLSEPVEAVVADLKVFIPEYRRKQNIPGVGIALIRDGVLCLHTGQEIWHTVDYGDIIANRGLPTQLAVRKR